MVQATSLEPPAADEALLRRCADGDRAAFDALVDRHGDALFRFATRQCGRGRDAEDAIQDGLLAAWRGARTWRGEASPRSWLFQIVLNACRRRARRRAGEPDAHAPLDEAVTLADGGVRADDHAAARQTAGALSAALALLPEEAREVLLLRDVEGLEGPEAAAALGIGLAAMKSRLHRARLELKERVEAILGHPLQEDAP
jgi:RNA polymerase sigma-70 factor (ECF subfamily)